MQSAAPPVALFNIERDIPGAFEHITFAKYPVARTSPKAS